jgi:maleylacetoacetate isomerase
MPRELTLYHYWRSSSSWRVRYGLSHLGLKYEAIAINLLNGESESAAYLTRNPAGFVPALEIRSGTASSPQIETLTESLAILGWMNDVYGGLLPTDPILKAKAWALAEVVNAGTQPLQNIPVMNQHSNDPQEQKRWNQHWIRNGLEVFETLAQRTAGAYSVGDTLTVADLCLIPQLYNAERWEVPYTDLQTLVRIQETCVASESYLASHPDAFKPPA